MMPRSKSSAKIFRVQKERYYEALLLNSPAAIVIVDLRGRIIECNPAFERMFGYTQSEVLGKNIDRVVASPEDYLQAAAYTHRIIADGETFRGSGRRRKKDGSFIDVEMQGVPVVVDGERVGILAIYDDVTDRKKAEEALRDFYSSFLIMMDSINADVYVADMDTYEILFMNQHMRESFGGDFVGKVCWKVFRGENQPCPNCSNDKLLDKNGSPTGVYVWEGRNPITGRWYRNSDRAIKWIGGHYVRLQIATDITDLKEAERRLEHMATHDSLTGLPNRVLFNDRLEHILKVALRTPTCCAVLFLDLDGFKSVNDDYGHHTGDLVLKAVADRLREIVRRSDTVARVSGDEFTIILENLPDPEIASQIAEKVVNKISEPYNLDGCQVRITASVGISTYPQDGTTAEELLRKADEAMYMVKRKGKNGCLRFGRDEGAL